jgi:hypothetical protein
MLRRVRFLVLIGYLSCLGAAARAHPFLDMQPVPLPPTAVSSGSSYTLTMVLEPGDTPVVSLRVDFELSSPAAFTPPSGPIGEGFTFVYDKVADPTHFSVIGDFSESPLPEFGQFPVAELTMVAGLADGTLSMLDSSLIVALEEGVPEEFTHDAFSNVRFSDEVAHVLPEPDSSALAASGMAVLLLLSRATRRGRGAA